MANAKHKTPKHKTTPNHTTTRNQKTVATPSYTVPGMARSDAERVIDLLQDRLNSLNDLALTLKHVHWNVTGPHFIAVHTMLDPQVDAVRTMADATAERIAALGGSPVGTPGALVKQRDWDDYSIGRADAIAHLGALDLVYAGSSRRHRGAIDETEDLDPVIAGHADRADRPARAVPVVRPCSPGDHRRPRSGPAPLPPRRMRPAVAATDELGHRRRRARR